MRLITLANQIHKVKGRRLLTVAGKFLVYPAHTDPGAAERSQTTEVLRLHNKPDGGPEDSSETLKPSQTMTSENVLRVCNTCSLYLSRTCAIENAIE